ncbi:MAG: hypothetical protein R2702_18685 [Acidimicrobiales bacterium]
MAARQTLERAKPQSVIASVGIQNESGRAPSDVTARVSTLDAKNIAHGTNSGIHRTTEARSPGSFPARHVRFSRAQRTSRNCPVRISSPRLVRVSRSMRSVSRPS